MKRAGVAVRSIILAVLIAAVFSMAGCFDTSAYDIAVKNGFAGTEAEWLESLKGAPGKNGKNAEITIYDIYDAYKEVNPDATFEEFLSQYINIEYSPADQEKAVAKAMKSVVSIFCKFTKGSGKNATTYGSAGAGVIYRLDGETAYIITNYHVVYDSDSNTANKISNDIDVYLYGGHVQGLEISAFFVGGSISKDIAVIKAISGRFDSDTIAEADIADSNGIFAGATVFAVGNPEADGISVTAGVISVDSENITMKAISDADTTVIHRVIRADAAINGGNSGGGLFDGNGKLIGIVNAKMVDTSIENIGYAIPSVVATGIADKVMSGAGEKCLLGISTVAVDSRAVFDAVKNRIYVEETVGIVEVTESGSAFGILQADDILLSALLPEEKETALTRNFHLSDYLYKAETGDKLTLNIERNGERLTVEITLNNTSPL